MTEPTDAEIDALWRFEASKNWDSTLAMRTSFARAVLAKFGTPAFVGVEPYAQHAIWHVRDGDMGWDQYHDSSDPMPLGWDGDAPDEVIDLYTAAQAQAGAVPPPWMEPCAFFGGRPPRAMDIDSEDFYGITEAIHHALEMLGEHDDANTDASPLDPKRSRRLCQALMAAWMLEYPREAAAHGIKGGQHDI